MQDICAVIAAAGLGTRLKNYKNNHSTKILIDIGENSMISTQVNQILSWGINNFVIITNPEFDSLIRKDINETHPNINVKFVVQDKPLGIAHALLQAELIVNKYSKILFVLGDNFFGENPVDKIFTQNLDTMIFLKEVTNPNEFGVAKLESGQLVEIVEKPKNADSNLAVVGIYLYNRNCFELIKNLEYSERGELEITDLNNKLIKKNLVNYKILESWWIDAGTEERIEKLKKII
jgi:glucose-1-phosphate thymidylyltransferase